MTAPRAAIVFNNSTGSDTAASGLGPATAVTGTAAAHTGGAASTTITLTNTPDLSGVQAGDLLWLKTASGRQFSVIASVNDGADTVTVDDSFNIASGSAVDYAIGGKRATLDNADSRKLFTDVKNSWTITLEYTGSNYTLTTALSFNCSAGASAPGWTLQGDSETNLAVIEQTANVAVLASGAHSQNIVLKNLRLINTNATKTSAYGIQQGYNPNYVLVNCVLGSYVSGERLGWITSDSFQSSAFYAFGCAFINGTIGGISWGSSVILRGCYIADNAGIGVEQVAFSGATINAHDCIFDSNASHGMYQRGTGAGELVRCTLYNNGGSGLDLTYNGNVRYLAGHSNIFKANGAYGLNANAGAGPFGFFDYNNYHANTSGARNNFAAGDHDLALDPQFTNAAGGDFTIGTNLKAAGFPDSTRFIGANQSGTKSYVDIGAAQRQERGPQARFILGV